jgi:hypothetical protein
MVSLDGKITVFEYHQISLLKPLNPSIISSFGMTELAHGSNVAGLETTATFDEKTDEFVIHTPHVGATKWWIGGEILPLPKGAEAYGLIEGH